ncbi:hypothetical protein [Sphingobium naphthae]|uniref:Uncharacterized protein n=1 Tax=Sphingobium naphthae TaxID=1886786 RepID=A0ABU4A0P5_9SPHN|nr:hypothetical protein [Sphingobium naphthae]MDV5825352.1 hypothetical protein [Sphingobium naphthae]
MDDYDTLEKRFFPDARCIAVLAELNAWTPVNAILKSARHLEGRRLPEDDLDSRLIMPMEHGHLFEAVFMRTIQWLVESYRLPEAKLLLAREIDPAISDTTASRLRAARFHPTINSAPLNLFDSKALPPPEGPNVFLIDDEPIVIELLQAPLRCLMDILTFSFEKAEDMSQLRAETKQKTGGAPTIYHRPYADSRLYATLEALCYFAHGLEIGPFPASDGRSEIDLSYRAVNVRSRPPIDPKLLGIARGMMEDLLRGLE